MIQAIYIKGYLEFIYKGLIITTVPRTNQIILIYMNTYIFEDNRSKILSNIKGEKLFSHSYLFNCGGKEIFQKIKE